MDTVAPSTSTQWLHVDHLGSTRIVTDETGDVVSRHKYLPFGEEFDDASSEEVNTHKFTGHERDTGTGLDYMMARYYSSNGLFRFASVDPVGDVGLRQPQSWNPYVYVGNNPMGRYDLSGLSAKKADDDEEDDDEAGDGATDEESDNKEDSCEGEECEKDTPDDVIPGMGGPGAGDDWISKLPPAEKEIEIRELERQLQNEKNPKKRRELIKRIRGLRKRPSSRGKDRSDHHVETQPPTGAPVWVKVVGVGLIAAAGVAFALSWGGSTPISGPVAATGLILINTGSGAEDEDGGGI